MNNLKQYYPIINYDNINNQIIIQPYKVSKRAEQYYKEHVRDNENKTYEEIRLKLSRDILLSREILPNKDGARLFLYGKLEILLKNDKIIWLRNSNKSKSIVDKEKVKELNEIMGIKEE